MKRAPVSFSFKPRTVRRVASVDSSSSASPMKKRTSDSTVNEGAVRVHDAAPAPAPAASGSAEAANSDEEISSSSGCCRDVAEFEMLDQVGRGEFGVVRRARLKRKDSDSCNGIAEDSATLAVKELVFDFKKEGFPIEALRELSIISSMQHPNIVKVIAIATGKDSSSSSSSSSSAPSLSTTSGSTESPRAVLKWYLVMESVDHSLKELIAGAAETEPFREEKRFQKS